MMKVNYLAKNIKLRLFKPNKSINLFVILLFLLCTCVSFAAQSHSPAIKPKEKGISKPARLRLVIKPFIMSGGNIKYASLQDSLPELIALGLIENDSVKYISHDALLQAAMKRYQPESLQQRQYVDLLFDDAVFVELGVDLVMTGKYFESEDKIYIKAYIENRINKERPKPLPLKSGTAREIYPIIRQLADNLNETIFSITGKPVTRFAVSCFKNTSENPTDAEKWREKDIASAIASGLQRIKKPISVISFSDKESTCDDDINKIPSNVDAILKGTFSIDGDQIVISSEIYFTKTGSTVGLMSQKDDIANYYAFLDNLEKNIRSVVGTIVDEEGKLDAELLVFKADTAEEYIEKGREYLKRSNLYVAAEMLEKAIIIDPNNGEGHYNLGMAKHLQGNNNEALKAFEKTIYLINKKRENKEPVDKRLEAKAYQGKGNSYLDQANYEKAIFFLNKAADICPDLDGIYFTLGKAYYISGDTTKSIKKLEKALAKDPDNSRIYAMLGNAYLTQKSFDESIGLYKNALKINPEDAQILSELNSAYTEKGFKLIADGKFEDALKNYNEALNHKYKSEDINYYKGYVLYELGRLSEAEEAYTQSIDITPQSYTYSNRGLIYEKQNKLDKALEDYGKAIELDPKYTLGYNIRGELNEKLNNHDKALEDYNKAIELDPKYAPGYNNRGLVREKLNKFDQALEDYSKAIELDPKYASAYSNRGLLYEKRNNHDKAFEDYNKALENYSKAINLNPKYAFAYNNRGLIHEKLNKLDKALEDYNKAIELDPKYANAYISRGVVYDKLNKLDQALEEYNKAIELNPKSAFAYNNRGVVYYKQNKLDQALEEYNKAIELNPKSALAYNNRGVVYYKQNKLDQAFEDYDKAIELDPKYTEAYDSRGLVYEKQNKLDQALEDYSKAIEINPGYVNAYINRGFVYGNLKKFEMASEDYHKAIELKTPVTSVYLNLSEALIISENYKKALDNVSRSFPLMVELKDKTVNLYLKCITEKLLDMDISGTESALNQLLKQKIDFTWSFEEIETWAAANAKLSDQAKNYIKDKSEMLKKNMQ